MIGMELTPEAHKKIEALRKLGFVVGKRDPKMNTNHKGDFMVAEPYSHCGDDYTQPDAMGGDGIWCIVGDHLMALVNEAISFFEVAA